MDSSTVNNQAHRPATSGYSMYVDEHYASTQYQHTGA